MGEPENSGGGPAATPSPPTVDRDWRAVIVAVVGMCVLAIIAVVGFILVPGSVPEDEVSTKGENVVAISAAAFTAVGTILGAYFGIRASNLAREESTKESERSAIRATNLAGVAPEDVAEANERATQQIQAAGLAAQPSTKGGRRGRR